LIGREATEPCEIGGYDIPKGMTLWACQWVMHRDERYWEEPLVFRPERWEDDPLAKHPRLIYFPFGAGPRVCIGNTFAMMEAGLILSTLLQQVRVNMHPGTDVHPTAAFTLRPSGPIPFKVEKRPRFDRQVEVA
ncbi:MAG: cytochrome P450, partial [Planctomycetaceae bacterium]|nr:cytochrome P450 [Planctomycetaceae bacterium]